MGLNFEQVWAMFQESDRQMQALRESQRETERLMKESQRESHEKAEEEMRELRESQRETERLMKESQQETERLLQETARQMKKTDESLGKLGNRFGDLAEHLVAPGIEEKFNALGYHFNGFFPNAKIRNKKKEVIAEIDILLENDDYSVAVEVKAQPKESDIDDFKRRLGVLRKYKDGIPDPRKIHGAIAGAIFEKSVKKAALKAGFYVIEQTGDTVKINVPEGFKPKEW